VDISFEDDKEQFGGFVYNAWGNQEDKIKLPLLSAWLSDGAGQKAELLYAALRDAMMSGSKYLGVRLWKKQGDGVMTQSDKEQGYSRHYPIFGMVTWPGLQAEKRTARASTLGRHADSVSGRSENSAGNWIMCTYVRHA
jgi:hypothetical protein